MGGMLRIVRMAVGALLAILLLGSVLEGNVGAAQASGLLLVAFVLVSDTFGARTRILKVLAPRRGEARGEEGAPALPSGKTTSGAGKRNDLKLQLSSLPEPFKAAIDSLADNDVDQLAAAVRRLRLESGGALVPKKGEAVIGYRRGIQRYEWKRRTVRQGGGSGWALSDSCGVSTRTGSSEALPGRYKCRN